MDKKSLRKYVKDQRDSMSEEVKKDYDERLKNDFLSLPEVIEAKNIFAYLNFGSEINTIHIIKELIKNNKKVYIPWINQEEKKMYLTQVTDLDKECQRGYYGILEVKEEYLRPYTGPIDVVLTPGLVFDKKFYRIGYGGGFYDKYFASLENNSFKIALAYEFQLVEELPREEFDQKIDAILTEKTLYRD